MMSDDDEIECELIQVEIKELFRLLAELIFLANVTGPPWPCWLS